MKYKKIIERNGKKYTTVREYATAKKVTVGHIHHLITDGKLVTITDPVTGWKFIEIGDVEEKEPTKQ